MPNKGPPTIHEIGPVELLPDMTDETVDEKFKEMIEENRYREVVL